MRHRNGFGAVTGASLKTAQAEINQGLVTLGFLPIKVDGIMGPKTCGAARVAAHPILPELKCTSFTEPLRNPAGPQVPAPGPNSPAGPAVGPLAPAPAAAGMFGFDTKTILIGAALVGAGVVGVYYLKKKSAAGAHA